MVSSTDEEITITRNGRAAAVLVSHDEFESWKETSQILADAAFRDQIRRGIAELKRGRARRFRGKDLDRLFRAFVRIHDRAVRLPPAVQSIIRSLHPDLKRRVRLALELIRDEPVAGKALRGELEGWRSLRVSRLRIVHREIQRSIEVAAIGPRASTYVETELRLRRGLRARNAKGGT